MENWPSAGHLSFENVTVKYRPETDLVLKGLTFEVEPGMKIGLIGRSGAGKSTLASVLARLVEVSTGVIKIDGVDTSTVPLQVLRQ
jgi:ABC-type multidrug transport system fused ATPase/permease subunit